MSTKYPWSLKDRAVHLMFDLLDDEDARTRYTLIRQNAPKPSITVETLRRWLEQDDVHAGRKWIKG